jgi:glycosyltransferase involved in cell wall biosynthesis
MTMKAVLAYDVFHYRHILDAMVGAGYSTVGCVPWAPSDATAKFVTHSAFRATPLHRIGRRSRAGVNPQSTIESLGWSQFLAPTLAQLRRPISPSVACRILKTQGSRVMKLAGGADVLHFVEGLGLEAIYANSTRLKVGERRNLHESAFENIESLSDEITYAVASRGKQVIERMDEETHAADFTVVYSEIARQSYLDAGFKDTFVVCPLGTNALPLSVDELEVPRNKNILYIGRGTLDKGLDIAVGLIKELGAPYRLLIAGEVPPETVHLLALKPNIALLGVVSRHRLAELSRFNPVVIAPSVESFGLATLDAVIKGSRAICAPTTGLTEWLPDGTFSVVAERTAAAWAQAVQHAINNDETWDPHLRRTRSSLATALSWSNATSVMQSHYDTTWSTSR